MTGLVRCSACGSKLEDWELIDNRCPFCHPRQIKKVRLLNDEEIAAVMEAGCHNGHGPWSWAMGIPYCKACGESPPTHIIIKEPDEKDTIGSQWGTEEQASEGSRTGIELVSLESEHQS